MDFRPRGKGRLWLIAASVIIAVGAAVFALQQPSDLATCRTACFDAYARCSGANAIQCSIVRGDCEAKCAAAEASDDPAIATSQP